jgi:hypothetical protein
MTAVTLRSEKGSPLTFAEMDANFDNLRDVVDAHVADAADAHAASAITNTPAGGIAATTVQAAINELDTEKATAAALTAHTGDTSDAHDASAISFAPAGDLGSTDVQGALEELDTFKAPLSYAESIDAALQSHMGSATAHTAQEVGFSPAGDLAATDVQAAIEELDDEKAPLASPTFTGTVTVPSGILVVGQGGSEGGEIHLEKPVSGSTLSGNVRIDLINNTVRIFEGGGTARGLGVDLTGCAAGAGGVMWHSGLLTYTMVGQGARIKADMSDATQTNRLAFQSSVTNGNTFCNFIPNGTALSAGFASYNGSDMGNASRLLTYIHSTQASIWSSAIGTGTDMPLGLVMGSGAITCVKVNTNFDVEVGNAGSTTMAAGFPYIPAAAGPPTGAPTARTGFVPLYYDTTNNRLYVRNGGTWKLVALS